MTVSPKPDPITPPEEPAWFKAMYAKCECWSCVYRRTGSLPDRYIRRGKRTSEEESSE